MHESQPSTDRSWARTCGTWRVTAPAPARADAVSTLRVKVIGADPDADAVTSKRRFDKTQSYGRVLPSSEDCITLDSEVDEERNVFMDVTGLFERHDAFDQAVAFARTLPALPPAPTLAASGVRPRERLQLRLEPRDHVTATLDRSHAQPDNSPTLRLSAMARSSSSHPWRVWVAFSTAAAICFMSVLAVQLLSP